MVGKRDGSTRTGACVGMGRRRAANQISPRLSPHMAKQGASARTIGRSASQRPTAAATNAAAMANGATTSKALHAPGGQAERREEFCSIPTSIAICEESSPALALRLHSGETFGRERHRRRPRGRLDTLVPHRRPARTVLELRKALFAVLSLEAELRIAHREGIAAWRHVSTPQTQLGGTLERPEIEPE